MPQITRRYERLAITSAAIIGLGLLIFVASVALTWQRLQPEPVVIQRVDTKPLADGGYSLTVYMNVPASRDCVRIAQHYVSPGSVDREYLPLAAGWGGINMTTGGDVKVYLHIDAHMIPDGSVWYYRYVAVYQCARFPGLIRFGTSISQPIGIKFEGIKRDTSN